MTLPSEELDLSLVRLSEVDASNWRSVADVEPLPDQGEFVAPVTRYLCLAHYDGEWNPLAIEYSGEVVGHVMWALDDEDRSVWIGGLVVDAGSQGRGIGRAAMGLLIDRLAVDDGPGLALSYSPRNRRARDLYLGLGFVETGELEGDEVISRLKRS